MTSPYRGIAPSASAISSAVLSVRLLRAGGTEDRHERDRAVECRPVVQGGGVAESPGRRTLAGCRCGRRRGKRHDGRRRFCRHCRRAGKPRLRSRLRPVFGRTARRGGVWRRHRDGDGRHLTTLARHHGPRRPRWRSAGPRRAGPAPAGPRSMIGAARRRRRLRGTGWPRRRRRLLRLAILAEQLPDPLDQWNQDEDQERQQFADRFERHRRYLAGGVWPPPSPAIDSRIVESAWMFFIR